MSGLSDIFKTLLPVLGSALAGPLGGAAAVAIGNAIGLSEATQKDISETFREGKLTPEQLASLKALELQYAAQEKELGFKYSELEFKDRDSARAREATVKDSVNQNIAYFIVVAFVLMVVGTLLGYAVVDSALAGTLVGYLSAKCEQVLAYYFGSSLGSTEKTRLLAQAPAKDV